MYVSFSYGLLQKKGARAARKMFQYSVYNSFSHGLRKKKAARSVEIREKVFPRNIEPIAADIQKNGA